MPALAQRVLRRHAMKEVRVHDRNRHQRHEHHERNPQLELALLEAVRELAATGHRDRRDRKEREIAGTQEAEAGQERFVRDARHQRQNRQHPVLEPPCEQQKEDRHERCGDDEPVRKHGHHQADKNAGHHQAADENDAGNLHGAGRKERRQRLAPTTPVERAKPAAHSVWSWRRRRRRGRGRVHRRGLGQRRASGAVHAAEHPVQ